jgi:hypothetical protein
MEKNIAVVGSFAPKEEYEETFVRMGATIGANSYYYWGP